MDKLAYYFGRIAADSRNRPTKHLRINADPHNDTAPNTIALWIRLIFTTPPTSVEQAASIIDE